VGKRAAGGAIWRVLALAGAVIAVPGCASLFRRADPVNQLVGEWRLDSLAFYAVERNLPESTRELLTRYQRTTQTAARQFRRGEVMITTRYQPDSTYEYRIVSRDPAQRGYRERGRWRLDRARGRIWCRNEAGRACPHDRAVIGRVTARELVLHLELTGRGAGLAEYFRLVRVGP
jgi:hypothetical protein